MTTRRAATAVPGNYEPISKPRKRRTSVGPAARNRGATVPPDNPSGRFVVTSLDGIKNGGASMTHWCPDFDKTGEAEWTCPDCGRLFVWMHLPRVWELAG